MPGFDCIGFWIPCALALLYVPRAMSTLRLCDLAAVAVAGVLSYLFPMRLPNGTAIWPFYLAAPIGYLIWWTRWSIAPEKRAPAAPLMMLGFFSVAIPDTLKTFQWFPGGSTVGAMGWNDGLMRFWLYPWPLVTFLFAGSEWVFAKDGNQPFSWRKSISFQISPLLWNRRTANAPSSAPMRARKEGNA